jgi:phosphoserine phosphatase
VHSGKYDGENCHGKEKVVRFRALYKNNKVDKFYSDSKSDTPMAMISEEPYLVKGNKIKPWS